MSCKSFRVNPRSIVFLNVKQLLAWSRCYIWSLEGRNTIRTHNHLVRKWAINYLAKPAKRLSCVVSTYLYGAFDCIWNLNSSNAIRNDNLAQVASTIFHKLELPQRNFLIFRRTIECGFTLKLECDMIKTYSQMHHTDKYSQHSSIIWSVWLNGWVFVYELSECGFKSHCSLLKLRYGACIKQGVLWHSGKL